MTNPEKPLPKSDFIPFRDSLVKSSFSKGMKEHQITFFAHDPEIIVRVDKDYFWRGTNNEEKREKYLASRSVFERFSNQYGISVVRHDVVIGENIDRPNQPIYYTISELVHGSNLKLTNYPSEEKDSAKENLDNLYSALADYLWDLYKKGGWMIDLFSDPAQNGQFVWGKRKGETENKVWLVDVDGEAGFCWPEDVNQFDRFHALIDMIEESEKNLGDQTLLKSRQKIIDCLSSIPEEYRFYRKVLGVRRRLKDPTAGSYQEDKQVLQQAVDEFFNAKPKLKFNKADYKKALGVYFSSGLKPLKKEWNRQWESMKKYGNPFDWNYYNFSAKSNFQRRVLRLLANKLQEEGHFIFEPLEHRYGWVFGLIIDKIKPEVEAILKKMPDEWYLEAKTDSDRQVIAEIGSEDDDTSGFW